MGLRTMLMSHNANFPDATTPRQSLIAFLWPRVQAALAGLQEARALGSDRAAELALQVRTQVLLMASEPARSWAEVEIKVVAQALVRHEQACGRAPADLHLEAMLEAAIVADHALLNGDQRLN